MHDTRRLLLLALTLSTHGCGDGFEPPRVLSAGEQALVTTSNTFGFDLLGEVVAETPQKNVFISPLSVSMALGMTYNGARGTTAEGMASTLGYGGMSLEQANANYRSLIDLLVGMDPQVNLEIANSIWYRQGLPVLQSFVDAGKTFFSAAVRALDFADPQASDTINAWVSNATHGKVDSIVASLDSLSMMFLINAVYFKGNWTTEFDAEKTRDDVFNGRAGATTVPMMHLHDKVDFFSGSTFSLVHLPYGHGLFGMTVVLPHENQSVEAVMAELNSESFAGWLEEAHPTEMDVFLPRFAITYEDNLNSVLAALGMQDAFEPDVADFSGIVEGLPLYISEVKHKTYVKVSEKGTEAAAVTSVGMKTLSMPAQFQVNRPFIVAIHDVHSGAMIFLGRILNLP